MVPYSHDPGEQLTFAILFCSLFLSLFLPSPHSGEFLADIMDLPPSKLQQASAKVKDILFNSPTLYCM